MRSITIFCSYSRSGNAGDRLNLLFSTKSLASRVTISMAARARHRDGYRDGASWGLSGAAQRSSASGVVSWFLVDRMGSTVALTDVSGNLQTQYTYGPFGNTAVTGAANDNPYQFGGREADPLTGMYYLRGRFLDSGLSRFVSRDPAGFQSGGHLTTTRGTPPRWGSIRPGNSSLTA
jgi:RHS repeat-associated protein